MKSDDDGAEWSGPFTFIQCADTQFGLIDRYLLKITDEAKITWTKEIKFLKLLIQEVNAMAASPNRRPKFMVICGDLVDAFPDWKLRPAQVNDLKEILATLDPAVKLVCVCGNHDVGDIPTRESIQVYKNDFGADYYSFWLCGCKFIVLNSQLYFNSEKAEQERQEQDAWLDAELKADPNRPWKHVVVFQHIPIFINSDDEPRDVYFNLEPVTRKRLLDKLKQAGVRKVFCGHYHRNAGGHSGDLEVVVTTAVGAQLGSDKHGYRLVSVDEASIEHKFISLSDDINC